MYPGCSDHNCERNDGRTSLVVRVRHGWTAAGLQVEGISNAAGVFRLKLRLPRTVDLTDFCADMYDERNGGLKTTTGWDQRW